MKFCNHCGLTARWTGKTLYICKIVNSKYQTRLKNKEVMYWYAQKYVHIKT